MQRLGGDVHEAAEMVSRGLVDMARRDIAEALAEFSTELTCGGPHVCSAEDFLCERFDQPSERQREWISLIDPPVRVTCSESEKLAPKARQHVRHAHSLLD